MKLGSIVGIAFSCLLIIAGIVLCVMGTNKAEEAGQFLFTQRNEDGTYYCEKIAKGTNRVKVHFKNADVTVIGGAEKTQIEFKNFNPNLYNISVTPNILSFEEMPSILSLKEMPSLSSIVDIGENGINFKGLRYLLDFKNNNYDDLNKSIIISLADDTDIKILDISGEKSKVTLKNVKIDGDILLKVDSGSVSVDKLTTTSTLEIVGSDIKTDVKGFNGTTIRCNSTKAELSVIDSSAKNAEINVKTGSVEYLTDDVLSDGFFKISSETGAVMVNGEKHTEEIFSSPENYETSLSVITEDASIVISYEVATAPETPPQTPSDAVSQ